MSAVKRKSRAALTFPDQTFFWPQPQLFEWLALPQHRWRRIVELGAGKGELAAELHKRGHDVLAVDNRAREGQLPIVERCCAFEFEFTRNDLVLACRPDHSGWVGDALNKAVEQGANRVCYVGLKKNVNNDLAQSMVRHLDLHAIGVTGEHLWTLYGERNLCREYRLIHPDWWNQPAYAHVGTLRGEPYYLNESNAGFPIANKPEIPVLKTRWAQRVEQLPSGWADDPKRQTDDHQDGWIDPLGTFHGCGYYEHDLLIRSKFGITVGRAEALGFVRCHASVSTGRPMFVTLDGVKANAAQRRTLKRHGFKIERWQ